MKTALITGITGQDGSYLAELLLSKGYEVHGVIRRASNFNTERIDHIFGRLKLHYGDMTDGSCLRHILSKSEPDEVYNLAAQSHVKVSFECAEYTFDTIVMGTLRLLEAVRDMKKVPRFYQASTSEMFGQVSGMMDESCDFDPVSPYGIAKLAAHQLALMHREAYGMPISCGILFNHESPRRGNTFVTKKVCRAVVEIHRGEQKQMWLGNLDAQRDWGYAPEYVDAMWRMLQYEQPTDFVIATGQTWSVRELCRLAFGYLGMDWRERVESLESLKRPMEVPYLCGNPSKAMRNLGWKPETTFPQLVNLMMEAELER